MSRTVVASLDLTDSGTFMERDPFQFFAEVRATEPVYWHAASEDRPGFWVVAGYADVVACYGAAGALASGRGTVLEVLLRGDDSAGGRMLAVTDRPRHRQLRALMWRALSPRVLDTVARKVEQRTAALVERAVGSGSFDFATEVAEHVPMNTICDLLSVPEADRPELLRWSKGALTGADELDSLESRNELVLYFMDLAERRRSDPGDDVISTLATGVIQGELLSLEEVALNCYSLIIGGDESSRVSAVSTVKALAEHPAQWRALRDGRVDLDTAVEEALRWATPSFHFARTATRDHAIAGRQVRAGEIVSMWNISANNDERAFADPRRFDLSRSPNKHVALGHGPHYCLGAFLGRAELRALLTVLAARVRDLEVTGPPTRIRSNFLNGYSSLPVRFLPR
ncbi:cytochrome P450 [Streptomyces sp. NPDC050164]|uniref:cytochrome P450 n=1 Tax=Streptomyces sp. NPDC050164 TaxID=3365605 RepID=UPI0037B58C8D